MEKYEEEIHIYSKRENENYGNTLGLHNFEIDTNCIIECEHLLNVGKAGAYRNGGVIQKKDFPFDTRKIFFVLYFIFILWGG